MTLQMTNGGMPASRSLSPHKRVRTLSEVDHLIQMGEPQAMLLSVCRIRT